MTDEMVERVAKNLPEEFRKPVQDALAFVKDVAKVEYFGPYSYYRQHAFPGIVNAIMLLANAVSECRTLTAAPRLVDALRAIAALPDNKTGDRGPIKQARHIAKCALSEAEATSAPVSEEREELAKAIENTADDLDSLSFDFYGDSSQLDAITEAVDHLRNYAAVLRTPHVVPGEAIPQAHIITLRNHVDKLAEQYGKNVGIVIALRAILSHMTASRED